MGEVLHAELHHILLSQLSTVQLMLQLVCFFHQRYLSGSRIIGLINTPKLFINFFFLIIFIFFFFIFFRRVKWFNVGFFFERVLASFIRVAVSVRNVTGQVKRRVSLIVAANWVAQMHVVDGEGHDVRRSDHNVILKVCFGG